MKNLYKKLTINTFYQFLGKGLNIVIALITLGVLSRYLGVQGMGEYGTVLRYLGFFGIIADLGMNVLVAREISKISLRSKKTILMNAFTLRILFSTVLIGVALFVALFLPYSLEVKQGLFVASLAYLFILWTQIFNGVFQKHLVTQKSSLADLLAKVTTLALTIWAIGQQADLNLILWTLVFGNFLAFVLTLNYVHQYYSLSLRFNFKIWQELLIQAWPIAVSNALILVYFNVDTLMLAWLRPIGEVGLYHVAYKVLETFFQFMVLFIGLFVPVFTQSLWQRIKFKKHLQAAFNGVIFFGLPLLFGGVVLAEEVILLVGGHDFVAAVPVLQVLFLAMFFLFINHLMHNVITVLDLQKKAIGLYAFVAIFNILANLYAIPLYGPQGAAFTTLVSEVLIAFLIYFFMLKQKQEYPSLKYGGKILGISLLMFITMLALVNYAFLVKFFVGIVVYFGLFFLFLSKQET